MSATKFEKQHADLVVDALHIVVATPWRDVLQTYRSDEPGEETYDAPDEWREGDWILLVTDAREPVVISIERCLYDSEENSSLEWEDMFHVPHGIRVAAIERRYGAPIPLEPASFTGSAARKLLMATLGELHTPTPWFVTNSSPCSNVPSPDSDLDGRIFDRQRRGCLCCEQTFGTARTIARFEALQTHYLADEENDSPGLELGAVQVCGSCHGILHHPLGPTVAELICEYRPECPECYADAALRNLWLPIDVDPGRPCVNVSRTPPTLTPPLWQARKFTCAECGTTWSADDEPSSSLPPLWRRNGDRPTRSGHSERVRSLLDALRPTLISLARINKTLSYREMARFLQTNVKTLRDALPSITADCDEREEPDLATLVTEHKNGRIEGSYETIIERATCFEHWA